MSTQLLWALADAHPYATVAILILAGVAFDLTLRHIETRGRR